jgi:hypothetical protein
MDTSHTCVNMKFSAAGLFDATAVRDWYVVTSERTTEWKYPPCSPVPAQQHTHSLVHSRSPQHIRQCGFRLGTKNYRASGCCPMNLLGTNNLAEVVFYFKRAYAAPITGVKFLLSTFQENFWQPRWKFHIASLSYYGKTIGVLPDTGRNGWTRGMSDRVHKPRSQRPLAEAQARPRTDFSEVIKKRNLCTWMRVTVHFWFFLGTTK